MNIGKEKNGRMTNTAITTSKSLNILYVGTLPPHPGGTAIVCSLLIKGFATSGHTVRALAPITTQALKLGDNYALRNREIEVNRYLVPYFQNANWAEIPAQYRELEGELIHQMLKAMIADARPDIIIIGRESFAWHVPDLAILYSLPCILLIHGTTADRILNRAVPQNMVAVLLEQYRKVDLIVVVAKHLVKSYNRLGLNNIKVIPNAIDLQQFYPSAKNNSLLKELAIQGHDTIVVHLSNLTALKRPLDIVKSAELALRKNCNLVYVIVGDGRNKKLMEETCAQKQILEKFRFIGWVDHDRVADYINLADIVVIPSEDEVLPLAYLETQACGRLLLASDIPAAKEVIVDGQTGLLFQKGNIDDLTAKTLLAADNPEFRFEIGHKARERVKTRSIQSSVAEYLDTINEVVQQYRVS